MDKQHHSKTNNGSVSSPYSLDEILESLQEADKRIELFVKKYGYISEPTKNGGKKFQRP